MRPAHFAQLEQMFEEMDKDGDGVVTYAEFQEAVGKVEALNIKQEHIKEMFKELNVNDTGLDGGLDDKDSQVSTDEKSQDNDIQMKTKGIVFGDLLNALVHGYLIDCDERLYAAFLQLDEDMDGKITVKELKEKLKEIDPLGEYDQAMALIENQSFGKDGKIDYEEFLLALHPAFEEQSDWYPEVFTKMKSVQIPKAAADNKGQGAPPADDKAAPK